jgi:hypothetical protein
VADISVLVPYRGDGSHRDRVWGWVSRWWASNHPQWQIVTGTCPDGPWIKAVAVADALARAHGGLLVLADADVICDDIGLAVEAVEQGAPWAMPHGKVHRLTEGSSTAVIAGAGPCPALSGLDRKPYRGYEGGGLTVLPRAAYERVPLDPRFAGWGSEDEAVALAWGALLGRRWRGIAPLWHLWHPPQPRLNKHVGSVESNALLVRYQYAAKDGPVAMRSLIDEFAHTVGAP